MMTILRIAALLLALSASLPASAQLRADMAAPARGCRTAEEMLASQRAASGPSGVALDCRAVFDIVTDNDFYASKTDHWYSAGHRLSYLTPEQQQQDLPGPVRWLDEQLESMGWFGPANTRYGISLGQSIYTPTNLVPHNPDPKDHPYGGYAYFDLTMMRRTANYQDRFVVQLGLFGPGSWGRNSQDFVHGLLNQPVGHGWKYQIRQEWVSGLGWDRVWRLPMNEGTLPWGMEADALPSMAVMASNANVYGQLGGRLRLGRALAMDYGPGRIRPGAGDSTPIFGDGRLGWYVFGGLAGRAVGRDISIEGNSFKPSRGLDVQRGVADFDLGAALLIPLGERYMRLAYTQDWRTQEFVGQKRYFLYGSLNLSYAW